MDSAQSSGHKSKSYLLKIYSQHGNFFEYCISLYFISLGDAPIKYPRIFEKSMPNIVRMIYVSVIVLKTDAKYPSVTIIET